MTTTDSRPQPRTYGNIRRPEAAGLGKLGTIGTALLLVGMAIVLGALFFSGWLTAIALAVVIGAVLTTLIVRDGRHHRTGLQRIAARAGFRYARSSGATLYRSGPLGRIEWGTHQLPGLLAASQLSEWRDSYDRPFALVHVPATNDYTVVLTSEPNGGDLVDERQQDAWVAQWGGLLAGLGDESGIRAATVVIETAPDTGHRLATEVNSNLDPDAPDLARTMLQQVVDTYPVGSPEMRAWVALTFAAGTRSNGKPRRPADVARDLATRLPNFTAGLAQTGAGAARPATAAEVCEQVRTAYDPQAGELLSAAHAEGEPVELHWSDVGPVAHQEAWDHYRHDGAVSVTWEMSQAPRGTFSSSVLHRLLEATPGVDRKRVAILYRPHDAATTAQIVDSDLRSADFRLTASDHPSERARAAKEAAKRATEEEAAGAGLVTFGMLVTATVRDEPGPDRVTDDEDWVTQEEHTAHRIAEARTAIANLGSGARVQLRVVTGSQASAFVSALPVGVVPSRHLSIPTEIRGAL